MGCFDDRNDWKTGYGEEKEVKSIVHPDGASQGKTEISEAGRPVQFVYEVDRDAFFDYITALARQEK